jgi:hypothetical protein
MGSRVFVVALALGLPLVGCTQGDSQVVNTDPNNNGRDSGNGGNNGRTDGSRADGGGVIDNDGWSDFDGGASSGDGGTIRPFDGIDLDGLSFDFDVGTGPGDDGGVGPGGDAGDLTRPDPCGNGLDDDRNGLVDDGCLCTAGRTQRCFGGDPALAGRGVCVWGVQTCEGVQSDGSWGACTGAGASSAETCDMADNNCDGLIDETCPCTPGATRSCYSGPATSLGRGTCRGGMQTCGADSRWGACSGEITPAAESCDGADRNCDGMTTDGCNCTVGATESCYSGPTAALGMGACRAGTRTCVRLAGGGSDWGSCGGEVLPSAEACTGGVDEDCNGISDCADQGCINTAECIAPRCLMGEVEDLLPETGEILLIADRSGSMEASASATAPPAGAPSGTAVNVVLPRVEDAFDIGLTLFPIGGPVQRAPASRHHASPRPAAPRGSSPTSCTRIGPDGNTPTRAAIDGARRVLPLAARRTLPPLRPPRHRRRAQLRLARSTRSSARITSLRGHRRRHLRAGHPGPARLAQRDGPSPAAGPAPGETAFYDATTTAPARAGRHERAITSAPPTPASTRCPRRCSRRSPMSRSFRVLLQRHGGPGRRGQRLELHRRLAQPPAPQRHAPAPRSAPAPSPAPSSPTTARADGSAARAGPLSRSFGSGAGGAPTDPITCTCNGWEGIDARSGAEAERARRR